jgi:TolB-like protein
MKSFSRNKILFLSNLGLLTIFSFITVVYFSDSSLTAQEAVTEETQEVSIAFIPFEDKTGTENYMYLAESISEAVNGKMSKKFKFRTADPEKVKELFPDSDFTKRSDLAYVKSSAEELNAEIIVFGDYVFNVFSKKIEMTAQIYIPFIKSNKQLKRISNPVDNTLFSAADKVADQVIIAINSMLSSKAAVKGQAKKVITAQEIIKVNSELMTTGRFSDNGNGTVKDNLKSLVWQKCSSGLSGSGCEEGTSEWLSWQAAVSYCDALEANNISNWRLPTLDELQSIVRQNATPAINKDMFPKTLTKNYWTITNYGSSSSASWYISFFEGTAGAGSNKTLGYIRCVAEM